MERTAGEATDPLVGRVLDDRYSLDALLAHGGMATVFRATDTRLDRPVAVKVMARRYVDDPDFVARFTREARAAARLSTPEVVAVFDQGTDRETGLAYLVMELVEGRNLRQLLQQEGPQAPARAAALIEPVLRALGAAHAAGLVHRDVKPENVLLADDGRVKVADFGLARAVESSNVTVTTGVLIGTPAYLAPEQFTSGRADARTDVYATGVLLWELLTGAPPHAGETHLSMAYQHVHEDVPPPSTVMAGIPPALDDLVVRATSREPSARPVDGGAFLAELKAVAADLPAAAPPVRRTGSHATQVLAAPTTAVPLPAPPAPARRRPRRGPVALAVVLLLALLALGGGYWLGAGRWTHAPGVLGLTRAAATAKLTGAGLHAKLGTPVFDESVPAGSVRDQNPRPNGRVRKGGTVTLVLSKGPDRRGVPAVLGLTQEAAVTALQAQGLVANPVTLAYSQTVPQGKVVSTDPPVGTKLKPGSPVALVVSRGVEPLPVPDETGQPQDKAVAALTAAGFTTAVTEVFSDTVPKGTVVSQSPKGGTAGRGSAIALSVSKGPDVVTVPDVTGMSLADATAALAAQGLKVESHRFPGGPGKVLSQSPGGGTSVRRGSKVTLYVF